MSDMCAGCEEPIVYECYDSVPWETVGDDAVCSSRCSLRVALARYHGDRTADALLRQTTFRQMVEQGQEIGEVRLLVETDDEPEWVVGEPVAIDGGVVLEGCFVDRDGREWDEIRRDWHSVYDVAAVA